MLCKLAAMSPKAPAIPFTIQIMERELPTIGHLPMNRLLLNAQRYLINRVPRMAKGDLKFNFSVATAFFVAALWKMHDELDPKHCPKDYQLSLEDNCKLIRMRFRILDIIKYAEETAKDDIFDGKSFGMVSHHAKMITTWIHGRSAMTQAQALLKSSVTLPSVTDKP